MQEKERRKSNKVVDNIIQIIGEIILYSPMVVISYFINTLPICLLSMLCIFIFKHFFYYGLHLNKWYFCVLLSYSLFATLSFIYVGFGVSIPFMDNQPMIIILICIGVAYLNHYAGLWQYKLTQTPIWVMTDEELTKFCKIKGIKRDEQITFVKLVLKGWKFGEIAVKIGYSVDTLKDWSPNLKQKLGIKDWRADKN